MATIKSLIRADLNESSTTILTDAELTSLCNDGYKDTAVKGLCYENKITKDDILVSQKIISLADQDPKVIRVNYVEYKSGTTQGGEGMLCALPQTVGHLAINTSVPQYWFQWGQNLVVEPLPDAATYDLAIYASCVPTPALSTGTDTLDDLPVEFHECVYLFALAFAALKLKRWADAAKAYNRYIMDVQRKRAEFISKYAEGRFTHELPDNVTMEQKGG